MSRQKNLTPWRKGRPPCKGVWNASAFRLHDVYRYWNGDAWGPVAHSPDMAAAAYSLNPTVVLTSTTLEWRGLASNPNKEAS